jgi:transcriptional regulator with GAF, ATPase, and Fis domain
MKSQSPYREAVKKFQRQYIKTALDNANGNITQAALEMGLDPGYLHKRVRALGLRGVK